jgi:transmembrane sensor
MNTDELIAHEFHGALSEEEKVRLQEWRQESLAAELHYAAMVRLLEMSLQASARVSVPPPPPVHALMREALPPPSIADRSRRRVPRLHVKAGLGLLAAAAVATVLVIVPRMSPMQERQNAAAPGVIHSSDSEARTLRLGDGSIVRLAPGGRLVTDDSAPRRVWLDGRAFFAVSPDSSRPFHIITGAGEAVVLGTQFDLRFESGSLQLLVVEGAVSLSSDGNEVTVRAQEIGAATGSGPPTARRVDPDFIRRELQWLEGFVAFRHTPLSRVALELTRQYGVEVVVDSGIAGVTVSGEFENEPLDAVVDYVCRAVSARCVVTPDRVTIGP